ncbi:MAG: ABC transporter ATP-binding protein, partial [Phaeodactylibacter sp.]|nr:ABC transporter ATP-binding protein [Phaeodactylibacter sp.]
MEKNKVTLKQAFQAFIWPRKGLILLGLALIVISRLAGLVLPGASKYLIDNVIVNKDMQMLKVLLAVVAGSIVVQAATSFWLTQLLSVEAQLLISKLRARVQRKILSLPISYFDNNKSGALVSRIMTDVEGVRNLVGTGLVQLVGGTLTSVASLILLIRISPMMTLYVLVPVSIFAFIALKAFGYIRPIFRERGVLNAQVTGRLVETLNGVRVIKGFNAEEQENATFEQGVEMLFQNVKKSLTSTSLMTSSATFLLGIATTGIMGIGGYQIIQGDMTFGDFLAFTLYLGFMIAPIVQMSNIGSQLTEAFAGLDRTEEIMNMAPEDDPAARPVQLQSVKGDIRFDQVSFAYIEGKEVVHDITFDAPSGSVTALVGTSGSGKTTIAGLAASFLTPDSGQVTIDGVDLSTVSLSSYRRHLGV